MSSTYLWKVATKETVDKYTIAIGANSERNEYHDMTFEAAGDWHSVRTYQTFPTEFHLVVPSAGIDLRMKASIADSEFITAISEPSFWEGRIEVAGTYAGQPVKGLGFVEVHGYNTLKKLDSFLKAVSSQVLRLAR